MISFRYHIVSIVGVFLALALGIVIGTTALNGPITKHLRHQVNNLKSQQSELAAQNKALQGQVSDAGKFATTYGARLVAATLTKRSVVMVSMPGAGGLVAGVSKQLTNAGATVTGRLSIERPYFDASNSSGIVSLATGASRPIGWQAPQTNDAGQLGGSLLAYVLLGKGQSSDLSQVLGALSELHMVAADGTITSAPDVVVVSDGTQSNYAGNAELALVGALAKDGAHIVVAGDSGSAMTSGSKAGLVSMVRGAEAVRSATSTVDNADTAFGKVSTVLALANAVGGQNGQYGTQNGADALFPTPAN